MKFDPDDPPALNLNAPGNAPLIACVCGHAPDEHDPQAGCLHVIDAKEDFCSCDRYEVAP